MPDAPSLGEVVRRLDAIQSMLAGMVPQQLYTAEQRALERRISDLERDVEDAKRAHLDDVRELRTTMSAATEKRGANIRQNVYSVLIPSLIFLAGVLVQIYLTKGSP